MMIAKTIAISAVATMIASMALAAEVKVDGKITKVDKANGAITVEHGPPQGTVGSAGRSFVYDYKVPNAATLNTLQVGDNVHLTAEQAGQIWTATKIEKR